ncbi:MAG: T9SS type A sorting domain-containing protein [Candidatus Eisenbacteria bacterium]|nr:T9SS type A sorting domain-containing protein [Candidatus Eisenbacteria bacterium]
MPRRPSGRTILIALLLIPLAGHAAMAVPMGNLHCNDYRGIPIAPYTIGTAVSVTGVVTAGTGTFTSSYTEVYVQDATGAVMIYKSSVPATFAIGDSITFNGTIAHYRGHTEVALNTWTVHATGQPLPEPYTMNCSQVANQFGQNYCEPQESMLIRLPRVSYTGTWGPNQLVTLHDESGTCDMWIDGDTGVGSLPPPQAHFDVIGVLKQFGGFSPPYTSGYEILPRRQADIIPLPGPAFTVLPHETDIQPNQVTIEWETDYPADSRLEFGYTTSYELGSVYDPTPVTAHSLTATGLSPALIHMYRVTSENEDGETSLPGLRFCSGSRSSGETRVYFNKSVETALALGEPANGNTDLAAVLVERIAAADHSIDVAIYSFDLQSPADALIAAHNRGVAIRFVTENRDQMQQQVLRLVQAGITVIDDSYGPNNSGGGLMHDKFWVFDHRLDTDFSDDWVLTGSWNINSEGTYTDIQNIVLIQDESLAEVYTAEINEMWGSSGNSPDPDLSRFGALKLDDTPKRFNISGRPAAVYFGPSDNQIGALCGWIGASASSAHFGILAFTRADVNIALQERFTSVPGYPVRGVFDRAEQGSQYSQYHNMIGTGSYPWDPPADVWLDAETGSLHHKYMILDVNQHLGRPITVTGSSNWSNAANNENDENLLMIEDFRVSNLFFQEFAARYHAAGGSADLTVDAPEGISGADSPVAVFPNPAQDGIRIQVAGAASGRLGATLHDVSGRRIDQMSIDAAAAGSGIEWSLRRLDAGIYFLRIEGDGISEQRRITILK